MQGGRWRCAATLRRSWWSWNPPGPLAGKRQRPVSVRQNCGISANLVLKRTPSKVPAYKTQHFASHAPSRLGPVFSSASSYELLPVHAPLVALEDNASGPGETASSGERGAPGVGLGRRCCRSCHEQAGAWGMDIVSRATAAWSARSPLWLSSMAPRRCISMVLDRSRRSTSLRSCPGGSRGVGLIACSTTT